MLSIYEYDEERELDIIRRDEREIGREQEQQRHISTVLKLCREFGCSYEETIERLVEQCGIDRNSAMVYLDNMETD